MIKNKDKNKGKGSLEDVLSAIRNRYLLNKDISVYEFELGALGFSLNNKGDYFILKDILSSLEEKAGLSYSISDTYLDSRKREQKYTLYSSYTCEIKIEDKERFNEFCKKRLPTETIKEFTRPICFVEKGIGYLKFSEDGEKIKVAGEKTRQFQLLQLMINPIGVARNVESVFNQIRKPKDEKDPDLLDINTKKSKMINIIEATIKELQRDNTLRGLIAFKFQKNKSQLKARLLT